MMKDNKNRLKGCNDRSGGHLQDKEQRTTHTERENTYWIFDTAEIIDLR